MPDPESIEEYLRRDGWHFERVEGPIPTWRSGFRGDVASFRFYVRLTENWIFFIIDPFVLRARSETAHAVHERLLQLNRDMTYAKFALDSDDDVVLTVECPTRNLDYGAFKDALDFLSYYADRHYLEILNLAQQATSARS
jgi:hypothetical protein